MSLPVPPVCQTNKLQDCSREAITNAYDNTILYTDHFLARVVTLLQQRQSHYNTAMWYMSDNGESLGETQHLYLHGAYAFAPETQTHIPMVQWISNGFAAQSKLDLGCLRQAANQPVSQQPVPARYSVFWISRPASISRSWICSERAEQTDD